MQDLTEMSKRSECDETEMKMARMKWDIQGRERERNHPFLTLFFRFGQLIPFIPVLVLPFPSFPPLLSFPFLSFPFLSFSSLAFSRRVVMYTICEPSVHSPSIEDCRVRPETSKDAC